MAIASLDQLLLTIRQRKLILLSERECWPAPGYTADVKRAMRKHRKGLAVLIRWSDIGTCPARDLHRRYWRYAGAGRYVCDVCQMICAS